MRLEEAKRVLGVLRAAYPQQSMPATTQAVYAKSLADFTEREVQRAISVAVSSETRMPSIARIREIVFEERLQIPSGPEAWEDVLAHVHHKTPMTRCLECMGFGNKVPDGKGGAEEPCPVCRGTGDVPVETRRQLEPTAQRALDHVNGAWAVRETDRPEVLRAQFLKAYDHFRAARLREANLVSLGVLAPAAERLALEGVDDG